MAGQVVPAQQRIVVPFTGQAIGEGFNSGPAERVGTDLSVARVGEEPARHPLIAAGKLAEHRRGHIPLPEA